MSRAFTALPKAIALALAIVVTYLAVYVGVNAAREASRWMQSLTNGQLTVTRIVLTLIFVGAIIVLATKRARQSDDRAAGS